MTWTTSCFRTLAQLKGCLVARGLASAGPVGLVTSDAHTGLVEAIGATLPAASWQRCRTHYAANLMSATPKSSWGWVKALLHSVYDQPDADAVNAQFDRIVEALSEKLPLSPNNEAARADIEAGLEPVDSIAEKTGFGDAERMRRAFLRAFGQPPQALRRAARAL